jgi:hypothetical protein
MDCAIIGRSFIKHNVHANVVFEQPVRQDVLFIVQHPLCDSVVRMPEDRCRLFADEVDTTRADRDHHLDQRWSRIERGLMVVLALHVEERRSVLWAPRAKHRQQLSLRLRL